MKLSVPTVNVTAGIACQEITSPVAVKLAGTIGLLSVIWKSDEPLLLTSPYNVNPSVLSHALPVYPAPALPVAVLNPLAKFAPMIRILSPVPKSVMVSKLAADSLENVIVSAPAPVVMVSVPEPGIRRSLPAPPLKL
ncbi:MAG: hypothetical protein SF002_11855, partial [Alphaproteobacteria bacterium]|nr:hypothetical protein [Alphaproteobacteria bacterium]